MIFVAVGTQFPFDRLIRSVDEWVGQHQMAGIAQIAGGEYLPQHLRWERFMTTDTFNQHLQAASLIISHAGMGNIITALENRKPIIVMNRQHALGEHRNDHQLDGLAWMGKLPGVYTATSQDELYALLERQHDLQSATQTPGARRQTLVDFIDQAIRAPQQGGKPA
ncbi:MAG: glycosyl transferase family 28 [Candidatus Thiothrix moscowensis]|nr:glycosyl transferase family 28 [Candidatus Thiothrix moscowensis]